MGTVMSADDVRPAVAARAGGSADDSALPTPFLVIDVTTVMSQYAALREALPAATIYYAVKANPLPEVVQALVRAGAHVDVASAPEIEQCLALGIPAARMSFGHTVKKAAAVAAAHAVGIDQFTCDSAGEL
ncbi:MAG: ornithine decarboxylase, partial [Gemmatimonadota bacterium]|nr:ornithine decarboxylase [Gemmatimonadota bacterium]